MQVNDRLQGEVHDAREELRRAEQRAGSLGSQLETVEREKSNERAERGETESSLRQRAEGALRQLNEAIAEREAAKLAAAEAQGAAQQAMSAQDRAERDAAALKDVADALAQSKGALQRTMVEQLGALRAQLERSQSQNQQLERLLLERRAAAATTAAAAQDAANANAALLHVQAIETQVTGFGGGGVGSSSGGGGGNLYVRQDMSADPPLPSYSKFYNPPAALSGYGGGGGFGGGLSGVGGVGGVSSSAAAAAVSTQMEVRVQQQEQARHQIERHLRNQELLQRRAPASPAGAGGGAGASMPPRPPSPRVVRNPAPAHPGAFFSLSKGVSATCNSAQRRVILYPCSALNHHTRRLIVIDCASYPKNRTIPGERAPSKAPAHPCWVVVAAVVLWGEFPQPPSRQPQLPPALGRGHCWRGGVHLAVVAEVAQRRASTMAQLGGRRLPRLLLGSTGLKARGMTDDERILTVVFAERPNLRLLLELC